MQVSISTHLFVYRRLKLEHLLLLKKHGFKKIELWCAQGHIELDSGDFNEISKMIEDSGLEVLSLHSPFYKKVALDPSERVPFTLSDDGATGKMAIDYTLKAVEIMELLKGDVLVIHTGFWGENLEKRKDKLAQNLQKLLDLSDKKKFVLETEPHSNCSAEFISQFIEEYFPEESRIGICVDVGHSNVIGDVMKELKRAGEKLYALHISDNDGSRDYHLVPGEGNIPWGEVVEFLRSLKRKMPFTLEVRDRTKGKCKLGEVEEIIKKTSDWVIREVYEYL